MTDKETQASAGVASELNAELGFNIGDAVTVLLHGDDNEYTGTVTNPKKLWVELHDYGRPFIADECIIKTIKLKYTFNDAIFKSDEMREFLATRVEPDGEYGEVFFANDMTHAKEVCEKMGWLLDGEIKYSVSGMTIAEADAFIEQENAKICLWRLL